MIRLFFVLLVGAASMGACADTSEPKSEHNLAIQLGAVTYAGATDVCYSFAVANGLDQLVVGRGPSHVDPTRHSGGYTSALFGGDLSFTHPAAYSPNVAPVCSSRFGNGIGALSYVAPCDAFDASTSTHTVTLWLDAMYLGPNQSGLAVPGDDYQDPCPTGCQVAALCRENADTPVTFNLTILRKAEQGFFDIAVNFDNIFCSAKLDTCDGATPIRLVHGASTEREPTAVLALACTAGAGQTNETWLHAGNVEVTCGGLTTLLDLTTVTQPGNQPAVDGLYWAVYHGSEGLAGAAGPWNKEYLNVAVTGFGADCSVRWRATASRDQMASLANVDPNAFTTYPVITYGPTPVTRASAWLCSENPLNGPTSGVVTASVPCNTPASCITGPCTTWQGETSALCGEPVEDPCLCAEPTIAWNDLSALTQGPAGPSAPFTFQIDGFAQNIVFSRTGNDQRVGPFTPPGTADGSFAGQGIYSGYTFGWAGAFPYIDILTTAGSPFSAEVDGTATFNFGTTADTRGAGWRYVVGVGGTGGGPREGSISFASDVASLERIGDFNAVAAPSPRYLTQPTATTLLGHEGAPADGFSFFVIPEDATSITWTFSPTGPFDGAADQFGFMVGMVRLEACPVGCTTP